MTDAELTWRVTRHGGDADPASAPRVGRTATESGPPSRDASASHPNAIAILVHVMLIVFTGCLPPAFSHRAPLCATPVALTR